MVVVAGVWRYTIGLRILGQGLYGWMTLAQGIRPSIVGIGHVTKLVNGWWRVSNNDCMHTDALTSPLAKTTSDCSETQLTGTLPCSLFFHCFPPCSRLLLLKELREIGMLAGKPFIKTALRHCASASFLIIIAVHHPNSGSLTMIGET